MSYRLCLLLFACGLTAGLVLPVDTVQAQQPRVDQDTLFRFERFSTVQGLAVDFSTAVLQDQKGFLWIMTTDGLQRYDGYSFTYILQGVESWALAEDHEGKIWVGTVSRGLRRFDPDTGKFTHFQHDPDDPTSLSNGSVRALYVDRKGTLWVGTPGGLDRFDPDTGTFTNFQHEPDNLSSLSKGLVLSIYEDQEGILWVGTATRDPYDKIGTEATEGGGLSRFDRATGTFTRYLHDPINPFSLIDNRVYFINEDRQSNLYVGTCQSGLHRYDRARDRFERLMADSDNPTRLHAPQGDALDGDCNEVTIIHEDAAGGFWIGTYSGGLNYFDRGRGTMTHYEHNQQDPHSLGGNNVLSFFEDRQGTRWIATFLGGLNKVVPNPARWYRPLVFDGAASNSQRKHNVTSVMEDRGGRLWVGTLDGELYQVGGASDAPLTRPIRLQTTMINGLYEDRQGMIWAGSMGGLYHIDSETRDVLKHYVYDPDDPGSLSANIIFQIYEDTVGELWVGTSQGLNRMDRATGTFTRYLSDVDNPGSLVGNFIVPIYEDRQGAFWVGVYLDGGVNRYDRAQDRFTTVLKDRSVSALYEDTQGRFWVGTWGEGLLLFDRARGAVTDSITTADGLSNNIIGGIEEDDQGFLWIISPSGLSRVDPKSRDIVNFTETDGFPNTLSNPEPDQILKIRSGQLLIGGNEGATVVSLGQFTTNPHVPKVVVTGLQVNDAPFQEAGLLPTSVRLAHNLNDLTFEYVGLHFAQPEKNRYAYQLEGYDSDWRQVGAERAARYTSLEPGDYVFRVKAANSDGVWNETGASVRIMIRPPWWRTTWAYILYGLLFVAGLFVVDRYQRRRLIRKERERTRERELAQAKEIEIAHKELQQTHAHLKSTQQQLIQQEKMASLGQLTAGIAHEIKNPLNFVNNFAEVNIEIAEEVLEDLAQHPDALAAVEDLLVDLKQNAGVIAQHGKRADGIVHAMMQHASGGTGQREPTDINALVSEHIDLAYHGKRAQVPGLQVEIERSFGEEVGQVEIVPQEIGRVLLNLLGNAFDAVHEHAASVNGQYEPMVTVSTRQVDGQLEIRVCDNGPGIPAEIKDKIFEPFFTTKPTGSGTGLGLSLSYDIVTQGHGGTLAVESIEGEGATFVITLPMNSPNTG